MIRIFNSLKINNGIVLAVGKRQISDLKKPSVIMCSDSKHIVCYHPEPEHPFEFTRAIERKVEGSETALKTDLINLFIKRFDNKPALNPQDHWIDAQRLAKTFNEHPIIFKRPNRNERIKKFMEKTKPIKKARESI